MHLLQDNKNKNLEDGMRKKGTLLESGTDLGWRKITNYDQLYGQLVLTEFGLSHSQVTAVDLQEIHLNRDNQRSGPAIVPAVSVESTSQKLK